MIMKLAIKILNSIYCSLMLSGSTFSCIVVPFDTNPNIVSSFWIVNKFSNKSD